MNDGDAAAWKEECISRMMSEAGPNGELTFETFKDFQKSLEKAFSPYDAPGDALEKMRRLRLTGDQSMDEHIAQFRILVSQSQIPVSATLSDFFRETLPLPLQRQILCCDSPPKPLKSGSRKLPAFRTTLKE